MLNPIVKSIVRVEQLDTKEISGLPEMIFLLSDALRFWSCHDSCTSQGPGLAGDDMVSENVSDAFTSIISILLDEGGQFLNAEALKSAASYFVCSMSVIAADFCECVTQGSALTKILNVMRQRFISCGIQNALIDAAFSGIILLAGGREIQMVNQFLLGNLSAVEKLSAREREILFVVHCFQTMLLVVKGREQRNELSSVAPKMMLLALELLAPHYQKKDSIGSGILLHRLDMGTQCILHLIKMNDVLSLNSQDVSLILCQVNALLSQSQKHQDEFQCDTAANVKTFTLCCTLVSSLLKHHPKQLYGCASVLFCVLSTLWKHAMHGMHHQQVDILASQKRYELTRVFEALSIHKQVFKKHVVGLLLILIDALEKGVSPSIKQSLMPSAFSLIDMCSKYELRQLNILMSPNGRPFFSTIFEAYQKLQYKGQF